MALKVKLVRSMSGHKADHRATLAGLGLRRHGSVRILPDNASTRGMINKVGYLLEWSVTNDEFKPFGRGPRRGTS